MRAGEIKPFNSSNVDSAPVDLSSEVDGIPIEDIGASGTMKLKATYK
jgi:hypothetical protein